MLLSKLPLESRQLNEEEIRKYVDVNGLIHYIDDTPSLVEALIEFNKHQFNSLESTVISSETKKAMFKASAKVASKSLNLKSVEDIAVEKANEYYNSVLEIKEDSFKTIIINAFTWILNTKEV